METLEPSPDEKPAADCSLFPACGGCLYRTLPYKKQLVLKEQQVHKLIDDALSEAGYKDTYLWDEIRPSPLENGYRNKMEYSFGDAEKDGPITLGLHRRGSIYDVLSAVDCRLVHEDYNLIVSCVQQLAVESGMPYFHKRTHEGYFRHLLVRRALKTGEILVDLVTTSQYGLSSDVNRMNIPTEEDFLYTFAEALRKLPLEGTLAGILHTVNDSVADVIRNDRTDILFGTDCFYEELLGLRFRITPFSFFQTNSAGAEVLYDTAREMLGDVRSKKVFDLYSGTGTIAQILAPVAGNAIGVEIVEEAVEAAKENAASNGLTNCEFIAGDVLKVLDDLSEHPDVIILDPPRDGIHPKALPKITAYGAEKILYISCKPTSLARDLPWFLKNGYILNEIRCVDMFPATPHVETVVLLSKGEISTKNIRVEFPLEDMDMSGFQQGATYEEIKKYVLERHGLKVSSLFIAQIKRKCGLEMGENYNLPKDENARVPQCTPEKEAAIMDALRHFHMVS